MQNLLSDLTELLSKDDYHKGESMSDLITTLGPRREDELGLILPHEHVFVDLRTWDKPGYAQAEVADVIHRKSRIVRDDSPLTTPEKPADVLFLRFDGPLGQPMERPVDLLPVTAMHVVALRGVRVAGGEGLRGREVAGLAAGDLDQPAAEVAPILHLDHTLILHGNCSSTQSIRTEL